MGTLNSRVLLGQELFVGACVGAEGVEEQSTSDFVNGLLCLFASLEAVCLHDEVCLLQNADTKYESWEQAEVEKNSDLLAARLDGITDILKSKSHFWTLMESEHAFRILHDESEWETLFANADALPLMELERVQKTLEDAKATPLPPHVLKCMTHSKVFGYSYIPGLNETESILQTASVRTTNTMATALQSAYDELALRIATEVVALEQMGRPAQVYIPPIPTIILGKVSTPKEIGEATLEVRQQLSSVRQVFAEYEMQVHDRSLPLAESMKARRRLRELTDDMTRQFTTRDLLAITEWRDVLDIIPSDITDSGLSDLNPMKLVKYLLGRPLERLANWLRNRRVIYLQQVRNEPLMLRTYGQLVEKVFGVELSSQLIEEFRANQQALLQQFEREASL